MLLLLARLNRRNLSEALVGPIVGSTKPGETNSSLSPNSHASIGPIGQNLNILGNSL